MSHLLSKIKARLEPGWVRAALEIMEEAQLRQLDQQAQELLLLEQMRSVSVESCRGPTVRRADICNLSERLWTTGALDCQLPDGFFCAIPRDNSNARSSTFPVVVAADDAIPNSEEQAQWDILIVDATKDKTLAKLKEMCLDLVKGYDSNTLDAVRKIAGVVADFYGGPLFETGNSNDAECSGGDRHGNVRLLGQVKRGLCRPRALLFKYLADAVGLKSLLVMGLQLDNSGPCSSLICSNPKKHLTNVVELNGKQMLVDVMRHAGHLRPFVVKALVSYHMAGPGDSDSAEYDSCDSPLEPNSPLFFGPQERVDGASPSRSEPDIANPSWRHNRRKSMSEQVEANKLSSESQSDFRFFQRRHIVDGARSFPSSPEHPQGRFRSAKAAAARGGSNSSPDNTGSRARVPSMLSGSRRTLDEEAEPASTSSPDDSPQSQGGLGRRRSSSFCVREGTGGTSTFEPRRSRKRCNAPQISDDVVRAVRAIKEAMKQGNRNEADLLGSNKEPSPRPDNDSRGTGSEPSTMNLSSSSSVEAAGPPHHARSRAGQTLEAASSIESFLPSHPVMPFPEWNIDFTELRICYRVGIGSFGEVFRGTWRGTEVAVKVMLEQDLTRENTEDFFNEISLLSRLRHPNVILFMGACTKPPHLSMVTEYMHMGSLYRIIHNTAQGRKLSWRRKLKMLRDITRGLMCVQRMSIVHRDLKSANCLVDKHWCVKICDFGLSRFTDGRPVQETTAAGTPEWMAPELLRNEPVTEKCDIFSLGVIMWELCTLRRPWEGVQPLQVVYEVSHKQSRLEIPEGPLGQLISDCWQEAPEGRPSYDTILAKLHDCESELVVSNE